MQTLNNRKKILRALEAQHVITMQEFRHFARMFDLLATRNIECVVEETPHGTISIRVLKSNLTWYIYNMTTYCVIEKMDGLLNERSFDVLDYHHAFIHITVKYANFEK